MESKKITTAQGCEVRVYTTGQGEPLVYLHGVTGVMKDDPFLTALGRHYTVYAPVLPGFEDSGGEDEVDGVLSAALHGYNVINALGLSCPILMGHCLGGMIAAEMAAIAPNDISRLILLSPMGIWDDAHPIPDLFATLPFELPGLMFNNVQLGEELLASGMDFNDAEFLTDFLVGNAKRMGMAGKFLFPIPDRGVKKRLYRIKAPTRLIWGENDALVSPSYAGIYAREIAHSETALIPDGGHMAQYEVTDAVIDALIS
ncbi:MAG: alpha/beta hydrolase [Pseudomonadales bacterium]|nr:alpha/beta hydrolase [Pseudomonadales bacterium]